MNESDKLKIEKNVKEATDNLIAELEYISYQKDCKLKDLLKFVVKNIAINGALIRFTLDKLRDNKNDE